MNYCDYYGLLLCLLLFICFCHDARMLYVQYGSKKSGHPFSLAVPSIGTCMQLGAKIVDGRGLKGVRGDGGGGRAEG